MTAELPLRGDLSPPGPDSARVPASVHPGRVAACCSAVYGNPLAELLVGESLHPGGLDSTRELLVASRLQPGARLLDAGCGLGASARVAADDFGLQVEAVDASREVIGRARARGPGGRVRWLVADLLDLPHADASFDGILAECVLSTLPREQALAELRRVLRPGGRLVLSDVEVHGPPIPALAEHGILGAALCVTDAWREGELDERLGAAGFIVEQRRDRTASILALVDRVEARMTMAAVAARDMGLDLATLVGAAGASGSLPSVAGIRAVADDVRAAVARGELRYVAAVGRTEA